MSRIALPMSVIVRIAYYQAREAGPLSFEIEGPDSNSLVQEFKEGDWEEEFVSNAESGEWVGDHAELEGQFDLPSGSATVRYQIDWYPIDGGEANFFIQFL